MPLTGGTRLGPYQIESAIGAGGMGEVYKARDTRLDRDVAIKVLPTGAADDAEFRGRFEREARAISQLNHAHICTLFDVGEERPRRIQGAEPPSAAAAAESERPIAFLVMEYLEGETLAARLKKGPLPVEQA